jgi:thiosulfate dehydrogenase [quinone] large subunit
MSPNPLVDYRIVHGLATVLFAFACAGDAWGLGRSWAKVSLVQRNRWLR